MEQSSRQPNRQVKFMRSRLTRTWASLAVGLFLLSGCSTENRAVRDCAEEISYKFVDPSSARFESERAVPSTEGGFLVEGVVWAPNGFGIDVPAEFRCVVDANGQVARALLGSSSGGQDKYERFRDALE